MENKNGKGIFLGVVSVATLVVAIIGATFAFFSASTSGNNGSIDFGSTQLGDNVLTLTEQSNFKSTLVPVASEESSGTKFAGYIGLDTTTTNYCLDDQGNGICSVYQFTVTNTGTVAQPIYISLEPTTNDFGNLYYAIYDGADADVTDHKVATGFTKATTATTDGGHGTLTAASTTDLKRQAARLDGTNEVQLTELNTTLTASDGAAGGTDEVTYTIVFWVQETQYDQNTSDGGKTFVGKINVTTANGGSGVTGVIANGSAASVSP